MYTWRILVLTVLCIVVFAGSAEPGWYTNNESDGLAGKQVRGILQDSSGNLWFGTNSGLSRYDGVNWQTFLYRVGGIPFVMAILEDRSGNLWFVGDGTAGGRNTGVIRYDGISWHAFSTSDGLASGMVYSVLEDRTGSLWFGTDAGASHYDGSSWLTYTTADGLASNYVYTVFEDRSGNLWFGTYNGVTRYDGSNWRTFTTSDGLAGNGVYSIAEDRLGNLWFGTDGTVTRYDGASWRTFTAADGFLGGLCTSIEEDRLGRIWFATSGSGVNRFDGVDWRNYTTSDGLANDMVSSILEDWSGNLWFGTYGGVSRYDDVCTRSYTTADGLGHNAVHAILEDSSGVFWFGTCYGATRYDGTSWQTFKLFGGEPVNQVYSIVEDRSGNLWFGGEGGAVRYDGVSWQRFTTFDGLASNDVRVIIEDRSGSLWFGTYDAGVTRYDGVNWRTFTTADGLASNSIRAMAKDRLGNIWVGTDDAGVCRYDGVSWQTFDRSDGLPSTHIESIMEDHLGNLWFGSYGGATRYDGASWYTFRVADGLLSSLVFSIAEDGLGDLWFATNLGVSRYDGVSWGCFTPGDGLADADTRRVFIDRSGSIWFACGSCGVTHYEPDRVPPETIISPRPLSLSANTAQTITFAAAFSELRGISFSHSFDGSPWSEWSPASFWLSSGLADGEHTFTVKARDKIGNVDSTPAMCAFEIDATPPVPLIRYPASGQAVRGSIDISGTAADLRFESYRIEVHAAGSSSGDLLTASSTPVTEGVLCEWNTEVFGDGDYELQLSVADTVGLTGTALVRVIVDNHTPWAYETAPATIAAAVGGHIYTTNGEVHLYFPPHAFARDAEIGISPLAESDVPDTLAGGRRRILTGYEISWWSSVLEKAATLELSLAGAASSSEEERLALYFLGSGSSWQRLGGTVDASGEHVSSLLTEAGRYAVFAEGAAPSGEGTLSALSLTPRAFSPGGSFANSEAAVSFVLGRSGPVTVKVYNRAGRLVREVVSGEYMGSGVNLVRWDGRDSGGEIVRDGLYLVAVEALGQKQVKTVSVVR